MSRCHDAMPACFVRDAARSALMTAKVYVFRALLFLACDRGAFMLYECAKSAIRFACRLIHAGDARRASLSITRYAICHHLVVTPCSLYATSHKILRYASVVARYDVLRLLLFCSCCALCRDSRRGERWRHDPRLASMAGQRYQQRVMVRAMSFTQGACHARRRALSGCYSAICAYYRSSDDVVLIIYSRAGIRACCYVCLVAKHVQHINACPFV